MKSINIFMATSTVAFLATGCVKPISTQETQPVYNTTTTAQPAVYETAQPIVYEGAGVSSGTIYETAPIDSTVITTSEVGSTTYPDPYATAGTTVSNSYPDPYANAGTTVTNSYPDPYATGASSTVNSYPVSNYPTTTTSQAGGIHLQIAALKDYSTAEDYKNRLSLAPGLSAYVQRGNVNKVIVAGIPSVSEANRLKESRFPGAFIVQGGSMSGYTPAVQPSYDTSSSNVYNINNPYGNNTSSATSNSGIGVQVGAFGSQGKAQSVANSQGAQYPAIVKRIGQYYKVILTGFPSRSAAKSHAGRVNGFVVNY